MVKKLKELSNVDIDRICGDDRGYGGCVSKDRLPRVLNRKYYILNMQDEHDGGGTHWTMVDNRGPEVQYFDSMGQVPPRVVKSLMNKTGKKQVINKFEIQPMGSVTCGWYAIAIAKALGAGMPMADFISHFDMSNFPKNDRTLASLF